MVYLYHCTSADRIPNIAKTGLKPSEAANWGGNLGTQSLGKLFFADNPENAYYYGEIIFRNTLLDSGTAFPPVLLRTLDFKEVNHSQHEHESYTMEPVPPQRIEILWHGWKSIQNAHGYWEDMGYLRDDDEGVYKDFEGEIFETIEEVLADVKNSFLTPAISSQASLKLNYPSLKRGTAMRVSATELTDAVMKIAGVLGEGTTPNDDQELQAMVGDPLDTRISTFAQFNPNPGSLQLPNPLSPIEGDEIFFAYLIPGATFQANDGSEYNILSYNSPDEIEIENRWYPRIHAFVSIGDIRRSIHQWIEPITQTVPPPPPGVDYSALPVKVMDGDKNKGGIDELTDTEVSRGSGW